MLRTHWIIYYSRRRSIGPEGGGCQIQKQGCNPEENKGKAQSCREGKPARQQCPSQGDSDHAGRQQEKGDGGTIKWRLRSDSSTERHGIDKVGKNSSHSEKCFE